METRVVGGNTVARLLGETNGYTCKEFYKLY